MNVRPSRITRPAALGLAALALTALAGCATWSTSDVKPTASDAQPAGVTAPAPRAASTEARAVTAKNPQDIKVTEGDITDRRYKTLGELSVTVNKSTVFHPNPTRALVEEKLRQEAAKLGADAVVMVRYGDVRISPLSWGSMNGKGRAVRYMP